MPIFIENWIRRAKPDYFSMFVNAWLPFNAWYMNMFYDESFGRTTDKDIISHIRTTDNRYKAKILALLRGNTNESNEFKELIGHLHLALEANPLPDDNHRVSFSRTCISNTTNSRLECTKSFGPYIYKCVYDRSQKRGSKRIKCEVISKKTTHTKYVIEQFDWNDAEFVQLPDFIAIEDRMIQDKLKIYYAEINPNKPTNIVCVVSKNPDGTIIQPRHSIAIASHLGVYFQDDMDKIAQVLIQLLYDLRCKLFHAEINPVECYQEVYKYAFEIHYMLIKYLE